MRRKVWVFLNVLIIPPLINAQQNFAQEDIVSLILFGKATYKKMVQNLAWASRRYSNLHLRPYFLYLILRGEKYAPLSVRLTCLPDHLEGEVDHDDNRTIKKL